MRRKNHPYRPFHQHTVHIPVEVVELEDKSYHLIVQVEIDGIRGDMIIDTGASVTVIDNTLFPDKPAEENEYHIQSGSVTGHIEEVRLVRAKKFCIGGKKIRNLPLAEIDLNYVNNLYNHHLKRKITGLLGCDFFVKYRAVIDYENHELILHTGHEL